MQLVLVMVMKSMQNFLELLKKKSYYIFSSPELAQVSFSDHPASVCLSVLSVNFYIFDFFSRTIGPIPTRLGTNHPWHMKGFKFVLMKGIALLQGEIIAKE
jgi:hypothetical protein